MQRMTICVTRQKLMQLEWDVQPYSGLAHSDYHLLILLKNYLNTLTATLVIYDPPLFLL